MPRLHGTNIVNFARRSIFVLQREESCPAAPPRFVENQIAGDRQQPCRKLRGGRVTRCSLPDADENLLRQILGGIRVDDAPVDSLRYLDAILALAPDGVSDRLNRARLRMQMGNSAGAKEDFKWLLDQQPAGVDLERVAELYRSL